MKRNILATCFLLVCCSPSWTSVAEALETFSYFEEVEVTLLEAKKIIEGNSTPDQETENVLEQLKTHLNILEEAISTLKNGIKTEEMAKNIRHQTGAVRGRKPRQDSENFAQPGPRQQKGEVGSRNPEQDSENSTIGCSPTMDAKQKCPLGFEDLARPLHQILSWYQGRQSNNCPKGFWFRGCGGGRQQICQVIFTRGDFGVRTLNIKCI